MDRALEDRNDKLALIHIARKDRGLDDTAYRSLLLGAAGVESAKDISTIAQFDAVMRAFGVLGFVRQPSQNKKLKMKIEEEGSRCSSRQRYYIKGLWELASRSKSEEGLKAILRRIAHVDDIRFLEKKSASAVILALRDICFKAGFNPDGPEGGRR